MESGFAQPPRVSERLAHPGGRVSPRRGGRGSAALQFKTTQSPYLTSHAHHQTPRQSFDSTRQEAYLNLWRTYDRLRALEDELFAQHDLTAQQYNALRLLRGEHPGSLATLDISKRLISRAPDITRLLDKLDQRGLINRQRPPENRRMVQVSITPAGLELLSKLDSAVQACHERQLGHLTNQQLSTLIELLRIARQPHEDIGNIWS